MKLVKLTCPNCGAKLDVELQDGKTQLFCQYCGQKILINPDYVKEININQNIHKTYTDEAKIREIDAEERKRADDRYYEELERERQIQSGKKELKIGICLFLLCILITVVFYIIASVTDKHNSPLYYVSTFGMVGIVWSLIPVIDGFTKVFNDKSNK